MYSDAACSLTACWSPGIEWFAASVGARACTRADLRGWLLQSVGQPRPCDCAGSSIRVRRVAVYPDRLEVRQSLHLSRQFAHRVGVQPQRTQPEELYDGSWDDAKPVVVGVQEFELLEAADGLGLHAARRLAEPLRAGRCSGIERTSEASRLLLTKSERRAGSAQISAGRSSSRLYPRFSVRRESSCPMAGGMCSSAHESRCLAPVGRSRNGRRRCAGGGGGAAGGLRHSEGERTAR